MPSSFGIEHGPFQKDETGVQAVQNQFSNAPRKKRRIGQGLVAASAVPAVLSLKHAKGALHAGHLAEEAGTSLRTVHQLQSKAISNQIGAATLAGTGSAVQAFGPEYKRTKRR